jgi:RNA polymerase sigma-70 factor, ECF subfamily
VIALAPPALSVTAYDFREVYAAHFRFVWASLRRLGLQESDASDAAQEVFLVVHRKLADFEGRSQLRTWLFGICMRVAKDRKKRAYVRREVMTDELEHMAEDNHCDEDADRRRARETLDRVLDEMSPVVRAVFVMFEVEGASGEEIANTLGVPVGTVRSRLRLGRESFERSVARLRAQEKTRDTGGAP